MMENKLLFPVKIQKILLEVFQELNTYLKNMKKIIKTVTKEKPLPVFQSVSSHPNFNYRIATSFYSFRTKKDTLEQVGNGSFQKGCHAFVKDQKFGPESNTQLSIVTPYKGIPFEIEELEMYINLLKKIGFDITFHGVFTLQEMITKYTSLNTIYKGCKSHDSALNSFLTNFITSYPAKSFEEIKDEKMLLFSLGEDYKSNPSLVKYVALCYLRYLWTDYKMWFPRMFLSYYNYFKKIKIKPSLDKLLLFTYSSPIFHLYDQKSIRAIQDNCLDGTSSSENSFLYGYYSLTGTKDHLTSDSQSCFSSLLATPSNFKLIPYLEESKEKLASIIINFANIGINNYTEDLGRSKILNDSGKIAKETKDLILKGEFHKAYLHLKEKIVKLHTIIPDPIVNPPKEKLSRDQWIVGTGYCRFEFIQLNSSQVKELNN